MASPGELVNKMAEVLGVPQPTVVQHDRHLAVAGLRTRGGRGRSAAKMTPRDAAHLLVAVMGSGAFGMPQAKDTVETLKTVGGLVSLNLHPQHTFKFDKATFPELSSLPERHCFVDAVERLIDCARDGSLVQALLTDGGTREPERWYGTSNIDVGVELPSYGYHTGYSAYIRIDGVNLDAHVMYMHVSPFTYQEEPDEEEIQAWLKRSATETSPKGDLKQIRKITVRTILALGQLLQDK